MNVARTNPLTVFPSVSTLPILLALILAFFSVNSLYAQRAAGSMERIQAQQLRPLAMATADFDEDGTADLAIGYAGGDGGAIALWRGNPDALAPRSHESWLAAGRHESSTPFLQESDLIQLKTEPELLAAADVNGDGHIDLVYASKGSNLLQVMLGTGKGTFLPQNVSIALPGTVTALAAYRPGAPLRGEALVAGYQSAHGAGLAILSYGAGRLSIRATYTLPGAATLLSVANLDSSFIPDTAIVAGGELLVLHGSKAIDGGGRLEVLPVSGVEAVTAGSFLFDRHAQQQLAALTVDGDVLVLAHQGFDSRPYTPQEVAAARRQQRLNPGSPSLAQLAGDTGNEPWTVIENHAQASVHSPGGAVPILLRSRISGSGGDDLMVLNSSQQQRLTISHSAGASSSVPVMGSARLKANDLASDSLVAALSVPVNADGRPGVAMLSLKSVKPEFAVPSTGNTFYVNTFADNTGTTTDTDDGVRCTNGSGETCTLRDAVTFANNDAADNISGSTSDTIMLPAGTYTLTWQAGTFDANGNALTHLEILGPVTIIGDASGGGTTIDAGSHDTVFTINPGPYGSFNPSGDSYLFDTALENIVIENGKNNDNINTSSTGLANNVGGGINWDAFGAGNLTLTNVTVEHCTDEWGDGGGIWIENSAGSGTGTLTLAGGSILDNSSPEQGGGVYVAYPPAALSAINTVISGNSTNPSVNSSDPGGQGTGGGLFITARTGSGTPQSSLTGVTISSNTAAVDGGGIFTNSGILLSTSLLENNTAGRWGGGVFAEELDPEVETTITSSNFQGNSAATDGGGVDVGPANPSSGDSLQITLSRIYSNTSTGGINGLGVESPGAALATENWWGCNIGPMTATDTCDQAASATSTAPNIVLTFAVNPNSVVVGNATQLTAAVNTDSNHVSVAGAPGALLDLDIALSATVGSFTSLPSATAIDATGVANSSITPTSPGAGTATATLDGQTVTAGFTVTGVDHFTVSAPATAVSGAPFSITVTAMTASDTVFTAYSGTVHFTASDAAAGVLLPADSTLSNGVGTFSATLETAGAQTINVIDTAITTATGTANITVIAGAPAHLSVTGPASMITHATNALSITAFDAANNVATGFNGTVNLTSSDPAFVGSAVPLSNGVNSSVPITLVTVGSQSVTATDTVNSAVTGSTIIQVLPGAAASLVVIAPTRSYVGAPLPFVVTAQDAFGNVATGYAGTVHFTSSDAKAGLPGDSTLTLGTGIFSATLLTPGSQTIMATDTVTASITGASGGIAVTLPDFVVTTAADDPGTSTNCTQQATPGTGTDSACSLRDALLAAAEFGSGNISFSSTVFLAGNTAAQNTITLTNGTLNIPSNTTIAGATSGSGATLKNLITVDGNNAAGVFNVANVVYAAEIDNLTIVHGNSPNGGGIWNDGLLTIANSAVIDNVATANGGGVWNEDILTVSNSTFSGNAAGVFGGGIYNLGTIAAANCTFSANAGPDSGGGIYDTGMTATVTNSTFGGNLAPVGGGPAIYFNSGQLTLANDLSTDRMDASVADLIDMGGNEFADLDGVSYSSISLAPLGNYGGPTQTLMQLPGSAGICAGLLANIPSGTTNDQRGAGFPRSNATYPGYTTPSPACVDAGAVQTSYTLAFTAQPPAKVQSGVAFTTSNAPQITLTESTAPASFVSGPVNVSGTAGTLSAASIPLASGVGSFNGLSVTSPTTIASDRLSSALALNATLTLTATSSSFQVVTFTLSPAAGALSSGMTGVSYTQTFAVNGGTAPYQFSATGTLPTGLSLNSNTGVLNGTPTAICNCSFSITVTDSASNSITQAYTLTIAQGTPSLTWAQPAAITYGTSLNGLLDAALTPAWSSLAGTITYTATPTGGVAAPVTAATVLGAGSYTLTATFTPTDKVDYATATATVTLTVGKATLTVAAASPSITYGQTLPAYTATYSGFVNGDSASVLSGSPSLTTTPAAPSAAGTYLITAAVGTLSAANYTFNFVNGTLTIGKATLTVTASSLTVPYGQTLPAYTATYSGFANGDSASVLSGAPSLTTNPAAPSAAGSYPITAALGTLSAANYTFAFVNGTLTISQWTSVVSVTSSVNPVFVGNQVTFTASVGFGSAPPVGAGVRRGARPMILAPAGPTGTVTFLDGATPICTDVTLGAYDSTAGAAMATCITSSLAAATHSITVLYNGDGNFLASTSLPLTETVVDFTINAMNAKVTVLPGAAGNFTFTVSPSGGATVFPAEITLAASGLPPNATAVLSPTTIAAGAGATTVTLTIQTELAASAAQMGQGINPASQANLFKLAPLSLAFLLLPLVGRLKKAGKRLSRFISMLLLFGIGLAAAVGISGCGSKIGFFGQPPQTYTVTLTGTSGALSHTATVTLKVD